MEFNDFNSFSGDILNRLEKINDELVTLAYTIDEVKTITAVEVEQLQEEFEALKEYVMSGSTNAIYEMVDDLAFATKSIKSEVASVSAKLTNLTKRVNSIYQSTFEEIEALSGDVVTIVDGQIAKSYETKPFKKSVKKIVADALFSFFKTMTQHKSTWQVPMTN